MARLRGSVFLVKYLTRVLLTKNNTRVLLPDMENVQTYTAFAGHRRVVSGPLHRMFRRGKDFLDHTKSKQNPPFQNTTARQIDFNLRAAFDETLKNEYFHLKS